MLRYVTFAHVLGLSLLAACGGDDGDEPLEPTYENVEMVLATSCAFSTSCHGGSGRGQANLNLQQAMTDGTVLEVLTMPSCLYDRMPRVAPGDPDGSWLMVKLAGAHDDEGNLTFTPASDWTPDPDSPHPDTLCPRIEDGEIDFGTIMPSVAPFQGLAAREVTMFREWIAMGAPGPL